MRRFTFLVFAALMCSTIAHSQPLQNFNMAFSFADADGSNERVYEDVCRCGTIYLKNLSKYNNTVPIGNQLTTGTYYVYINESSPCYWAQIPAASWLGGAVYALNVPCTGPCGSGMNYQTSGLNLYVRYSGSGAQGSSTASLKDAAYLKDTYYAPGGVNAGPDKFVCSGEGTQLDGSGASSYLWSPSTGLSSPTVEDPFCSPSQTTTYTLTGSNNYTSFMGVPFSCSASDNVTVTVNPLPIVDLGPNVLLCENDPGPFLTSTPNQYGDWYYNGSQVATGSYLNSSNYGFGTYQLIVTYESGCSASDYVNIAPDPSSMLDASFSMSSSINPITQTISFSTAALFTGDVHHWAVFNSDANGSMGSLAAILLNGSSTYNSGTFPLDNWYLVLHEMTSAPCNQSALSGILIYSSSFGKKEPRSVQMENISLTEYDREQSSRTMKNGGESDKASIAQANELVVFPNPTNGVTEVLIPKKMINGQLIVVDATGRVVAQRNITSTNESVDLSEMTAGIYFLKCVSSNAALSIRIAKE